MKVLVLGIDTFKHKNIYQVKCLNNHNYIAHVFTNDSLGNSAHIFNSGNKLYILEKTFFKRFSQIYFFVKKYKKTINHVEIYPTGRFSFIYLLIAKLFKIKSIIVERGGICLYDKSDILTKFSMRICYRFSDIVWYREIYDQFDIKKKLIGWGSKQLFFLPNAAPDVKFYSRNKSNEFVFLWANRFLKERKTNWVVDFVNESRDSKSIMLGIMGNNDEEKYALENQSEYLQVLEYQDPKPYFFKSKFFVFPSDVVFLNNALLEAMAHGLVPLISNVKLSKLIIDNGINGFIFDHNFESFKKAMKKALALSEGEYLKMSNNAIKKVKDSFSFDAWSNQYIKLIEKAHKLE